jgi:hypothetical protein
MWELFTKAASKIGSAAATAGKTGTRAVAGGTGQSTLGIQSPQLAGEATRIGRFLYSSSLLWIAVSWYTGYVNERTKEGEPKFIVPGSKQAKISPPDRKNKTIAALKGGKSSAKAIADNVGNLSAPGIMDVGYKSPPIKGRTLVALSPAQLGTPGTAVPGYLWSAPSKVMPPYSAARYRELSDMAQKIASQYGLKITSGYRPGDESSLHGHGLAFDMVGSMSNMKRADSWAAQNAGLFQEIFIHNEGSGVHLHIGFYPDAAKIFNEGSNKYNRASNSQAPAPAQSRATILV